MIIEKESNANLSEWLEVWKPVENKISRKELRERIKVCYSPIQQDRYWQKIGDLCSMYHGKRRPLQDVYQEIIEHLFSNYMPEVSSGLEFGCGPEASLYRLLPKKFSGKWIMVDINRSSPYQAKIFHAGNEDCLISSFHYPPFRNDSQVLIAGLNSFETTLHRRYVVKRLKELLRSRGYLLAMQDVLPSEFSTVIREFYRTEGPVEVKVDGETPILMKINDDWIDTRSYHIENLMNIGKSFGMKDIFCGIIESSGVYPKSDHHRIMFLDDNLEVDPNITDNSCCDVVSKFQRGKDPNIPDGFIKEKTAVNVLVLKK